jgi:hypothetical protein
MKNATLLLLLLLCIYTTQAQGNKTKAIRYIKDYYADFKTGYDTPGGYFTLTDNYKVDLHNSIFTVNYDTYMYREFIKAKTIQFDLKKVTSIYPNGTEILENYGYKIGDYQMILTLICGKLAFKTATEEYNLNIYYEVDDDVEKTKIYKAFEELIKN